MEKVKVRELFTDVKEVLEDYKEKNEQLDQQERELNAELHVLQEEMNSNMLAQETATVPELVYLKIEAKNIVQKTEVIKILLEDLAEERDELKLSYVPILRGALGKTGLSEYNVTELVERYRYEMLKEVADIGKQIQSQYSEVEADLMEVFDDSKVKEQYPRLSYQYGRDTYKPSFSWFTRDVVNKNEVFYACSGSLPQGVKVPKEKDGK